MHAIPLPVRLCPAPVAPPADAALPIDAATPDTAYLSGFRRGPVAQPPGDTATDWWLPGAARLCVVVGDGSATVEMRNRRFVLPRIALIGPTDRAHRVAVEGASIVSCAITPLGWSRLCRQPAAGVRNLVAPIEEVLRPASRSLLTEGVLAAIDGRLAAADLQDALAAATASHRDEPRILDLAQAIAAPATTQVRDLVPLGLSEARLRSLSLRHFGSPTKILLRHARFLRSLAQVDYTPGRQSYAAIDASYHDVSHFLRDADFFLGTTPRRFRLLSSQH